MEVESVVSRGLERKEKSHTKWDSSENVYETVISMHACKIMSVCIKNLFYSIIKFLFYRYRSEHGRERELLNWLNSHGIDEHIGTNLLGKPLLVT